MTRYIYDNKTGMNIGRIDEGEYTSSAFDSAGRPVATYRKGHGTTCDRDFPELGYQISQIYDQYSDQTEFLLRLTFKSPF